MSEVPSPQAELRAEMVEIIQGAYAFGGTASRAGVAADLLLPLFAARVAAIEEQLRLCNIDQANVEAELSQEVHVDMLVAANNEQHDLAVFHSQRADKAEAEISRVHEFIDDERERRFRWWTAESLAWGVETVIEGHASPRPAMKDRVPAIDGVKLIEGLTAENDRLRRAITASWDVCSRPGGCIPGRPW